MHTVGWCLIPSVACLCAGLICAVKVVHGEPACTVALLAFGTTGLLTFKTVIDLGWSTEELSREAMAEQSTKQRRE
jgi:hypothetical protein